MVILFLKNHPQNGNGFEIINVYKIDGEYFYKLRYLNEILVMGVHLKPIDDWNLVNKKNQWNGIDVMPSDLDLTQKDIWEKQVIGKRREDISKAISKRLGCNMTIPQEWIDEWNGDKK